MDGNQLVYYKLPNLRGYRILGPSLDLSPNNKDQHEYPVEGWTWFDSPLEAVTALGWESSEELVVEGYSSADPTHLRIYGLTSFPARVANRYAPYELPLEHDFGVGLGLQKAKLLGVADKGDIPEMIYSSRGVPICRRLFQFAYSVDEDEATILTLTHTPQWARNDGTWVSGPTETDVFEGARYNAWRDSARTRIFEALQTWLPIVLVELEVVANIPEGEALSGGWLAQNHAVPWDLYMKTGRRELIDASLTADETTWLDSVVPDDTIPGLDSGSTVREMILGALR